MNIWIMSLISMFPPLSLSLPLPRSLTWWLLGGGGGFRRCRRRCRCRCHCRRHRCRQRLPSCVGGGGSSSRESSFPLVISTADAAERDGQTKARKKRGREGAVPLPASPLSVSPQSLAIFWRAAAAASNPPLLPPSLPPPSASGIPPTVTGLRQAEAGGNSRWRATTGQLALAGYKSTREQNATSSSTMVQFYLQMSWEELHISNDLGSRLREFTHTVRT